MIDIKRIGKNILEIKHLLRNVWIAACVIEVIFFPSINTLGVLAVSSIGLFVCSRFLFSTHNLLYYPVSTIATAMYPFFFLFMPPIATLIELKPVTFNLLTPIRTFANVLLLECLLVSIHYIYRKLSQKYILKRILFKAGVYTRLTSQELWAGIIISLAVAAYSMLTYGLYSDDMSNSRASMPIWLQLLVFIFSGAYPIVLIFYMKKFAVIKNKYKPQNILIILTLIISFLIGITTNMRTTAIICFSSGLFLFFVYDFYFPVNLKKIFSIKNVIIYGILVWFFTGPFMDLSNAMIYVRSERYGQNGIKVLQQTFESMDNNYDYNKDMAEQRYGNSWDERYLDNHILNRFCSVKILDESLYYARMGGYSNPLLRETLWEKLKDDIPGVVKGVLNIHTDPDIRKYSLTDRLYTLAVPSAALGGVKVGTLQGLGLGLFGWAYLLILVPVYLIIFYLMDSLVFFFKKRMLFSFYFLFNAGTFVYWFSDRHYYEWEIRWIFRTFWEGLLFFAIFMIIVKHLPFIKHKYGSKRLYNPGSQARLQTTDEEEVPQS